MQKVQSGCFADMGDLVELILRDRLRVFATDGFVIFHAFSHADNHLDFDVRYRLAHKEQYKGVEHTSNQQIDLLIVVDQMLTGFDFKWINTLYLDKILVYEKLIQAFLRTNRLYGPEKPFGTIRYYDLSRKAA